MKLIKAADLAAQWDMTEAQLKTRVRKSGWPVVKLTRFDWRFTEQQIEQIVAMQSRSAKKPTESKKTGQSSRSAARSS